ncbi:ABC transporter substrate-binding protein [Paenochrobactrum glaciei]|uniref:ABC transporter substrate-binding protein n=2 Tax=Paenochrobactrum glaciei TaxID=486407 RepID=A0ABN1GL98_9HYPH
MGTKMNKRFKTFLLAAALSVTASFSFAAEKVTYLFPAPDFLPAFAPFHLAKHKGYFDEAGLDVKFQLGKGGADVAKQVAVGNADMGGGIGDTAIIVRANGLDIRGVALLGGRGLTQIAWRKDSGIKNISDMKGKNIGVIDFQDTAYYNLLAVFASENMSRSDANIQAVGSGGLVQLMISGDLVGMVGVPEWLASIKDAGVELETISVDSVFPAMAQAIIASGKTINERPEVVKGVVNAVLRAIDDIEKDPAQAAKDYVVAVPRHAGSEDKIEAIMRSYVELVYPKAENRPRGAFDPEQLKKVQDFYLENEIVRTAVPIEDTYTNQFVTSE